VREASSEALAAYALGATRSYGCEVPGSTASPVVKVVFDSLAEQKKEAQMGASQALLKVSACPAHGSMVPVAAFFGSSRSALTTCARRSLLLHVFLICQARPLPSISRGVWLCLGCKQ
jgi:hypothetical protein